MGESETGKGSHGSGSMKNIIILGVGFMLLLAAFLTMAAIEQTVLQSVQLDDPSFTGDGYVSMSLVNGMFSITNFIAPMIIAFLGVRVSMIFAAAVYAGFTASFLYPNTWLLYIASASLGFAAAVLWVANGIYFTRCCTKDNIGKYMGIYWVMAASGQLFGNAFVSWKFEGKTRIDLDTRFMVVAILTGIAILSTVCLMFLGRPSNGQEEPEDKETKKKKKKGLLAAFSEPVALVFTNRHMQLLIPASVYSGFQVTYMLGIYPTAVGFSEALGEDAKKLVGYTGILAGLGNVSGGLIFGVFGKKLVNSRRDIIVAIATLGFVLFSGLIYLNFAAEASLGPTPNTSWFNPPSVIIILVCGFLTGFGEGSLTPQVIAAVGVIWPEDPSAGMAMFRFFQAAAASLGFYISTMMGLYQHLLILMAVAVVGTSTFWVNEKMLVKRDMEKEEKGKVAKGV